MTAMNAYIGTLPVAVVVPLAFATIGEAHVLASEQLEVQMEVESACIMESPQGWLLDFGVYNVMNPEPQREEFTFQVRCTAGTEFLVTLGEGNSFADGRRHMSRTEGSETIPYALRFGGHQGTDWTETDYPDAITSSGATVHYDFLVYGEVAAGIDAPQGRYSDSVLVNVELQ